MSKQKYNIEYKNYAMKVAVILQYPSSSVAQAMHTKPTYPKHVEKSFHDYDETGKYMYAAKVDDTFWFFEERISGMPASFGGINTSFGMDMTMPFLEQQNWNSGGQIKYL